MFMSKAQPRATKEYYPPHLTGRGSRGLMALAFELFGLGLHAYLCHYLGKGTTCRPEITLVLGTKE